MRASITLKGMPEPIQFSERASDSLESVLNTALNYVAQQANPELGYIDYSVAKTLAQAIDQLIQQRIKEALSSGPNLNARYGLS